MSLIQTAKRLFDSNELAWMLPLAPWAPPRHRALRKLRRIARKRLRKNLIAAQGWPRTISQTAAWPAISTLKSFLAIRGHPGSIFAKLRQFSAYCWLVWAHNIRIADQEDHLLTLPHRRRNLGGYITCREHQALVDLIRINHTGYPGIEGKSGMANFCEEFNLPSPKILACGNTETVKILEEWPASDLALKPTNMGKGNGFEIIYYQSESQHWTGDQGYVITPETLQEYAKQRLGNNPWLLQPRLRNTSVWHAFTTGALSTVRVITARHPDQDPVIIGAYLRMPKKGAIVDNLCAGGIAAHVDIRTGKLSVGQAYDDYYEEYTRHPDTDAHFADKVLPEYQDIFTLALHAHSLAGNWCSIGWDIALTDTSPCLIEANLNWAIIPGIPITETPYLEIAQAALNVS